MSIYDYAESITVYALNIKFGAFHQQIFTLKLHFYEKKEGLYTSCCPSTEPVKFYIYNQFLQVSCLHEITGVSCLCEPSDVI
jgi:hypothetical protein